MVHCPALDQHDHLPQSAFLLCRSSFAILFLFPHLSLAASWAVSTSTAFAGALTTNPTKKSEQPNFSASRHLVHVYGSSVLNLLISAISASVKWYFFSYASPLRSAGGKFALGCAGSRLGVDNDVPVAATSGVRDRRAAVVDVAVKEE
jgi:hypothetical protein